MFLQERRSKVIVKEASIGRDHYENCRYKGGFQTSTTKSIRDFTTYGRDCTKNEDSGVFVLTIVSIKVSVRQLPTDQKKRLHRGLIRSETGCVLRFR